ncbi:MAG: RimK family alpha-L-glutamate ligase [Caldimicrobium sp.]
MIVSFYPLYEGDVNIFQFEPLTEDLIEKILKARAVIVPPTVAPELYFFIKNRGIAHFPEYTFRFLFPGKIGQILLFRALNLPHPRTIPVPRLCGLEENPYERTLTLTYPFVVKGNRGDEGKEVFLIKSEEEWKSVQKFINGLENMGRFGFLIQEYINNPFDARSIVIGDKILVFFREGGFRKNLTEGGKLIPPPTKDLEEKVIEITKELIKRTGFNLVAIDFLIKGEEVLFNELNFVFGRRAIGDEVYTQLVKEAIEKFLKGINFFQGERKG